MANPGPDGWDQPGDDPRLARRRYRPTRAVLGRWRMGKHRSEARRGESLDQLLAEREPEQGIRVDGRSSRSRGRAAGQHRDRAGAPSGTATQLSAAPPDDERDTEQGAMRIQNTT